jgi:hypothetical protein
MNNKFLFVAMVLFSALGITACYYDVEEELYGTPVDCDTSFAVSYSTHVAPVIQSKCLACHSAASQLGGINLEGYTALSNFIANGRLLGTIDHKPGFSPMPKGSPKIDACDIKNIERWIQAGALNN